jgi:peroxiredoxin
MHATGLILTNYHVVAGAGAIDVKFRDHAKTLPAEVLAVDRDHDIAFLQVKRPPSDVHVVELQSSVLPAAGATAWTIGHPNELRDTVGWGNINAVRKTSELPEQLRQALNAPADSRWLQTNAVLASGSSGGPLLNDQGQALGINTFVLGPQFGFAIHISHARQAYLDAKQLKPLSLPLAPGEKEDPLGWPSRPVAPLLKAFSQEYNELQATAAGMSQTDVFSRLSSIRSKYRQQFLELAEKQPQDWPGLQALTYAAQFCDGEATAPALQQICQLALQHHADDPHLVAITNGVAQQPTEAARKFCRQVSERSPHEGVRLRAKLSLVSNLVQRLQSTELLDVADVKAAREEMGTVIDSLEQDAKPSESLISGETGQQLVNALREQLAAIQIGVETPEIEGVDIEGQQFKLSQYRGQAVLLDFFADWCPHCRRMYPGERAMVEKMKDRPFALLGIHCESQKVLDELVKNGTVTWRSWADGQQGPIAQQWGIDGYPTMVLIDHQGLIRWRSGGVPDEAALARMVEQLVQEAESQTDSE